MKCLYKNNNRGGVKRRKLWWCLALGVLVLAIGCKQVSNGGGKIQIAQ